MNTTPTPRPDIRGLIVPLTGNAAVRMYRLDTTGGSFDTGTVETIEGEQVFTVIHPAQGCAPLPGYDPATDDLPTVEAIAGHLINPPAPVVSVPASVTLWALRVILADDGLLQPILDYITTVQHAPTKHRLTQFIEYGNYVERDSPTLAGIAALLKKTDAGIDVVFIRAAALKL
jgi:hypothetical protein